MKCAHCGIKIRPCSNHYQFRFVHDLRTPDGLYAYHCYFYDPTLIFDLVATPADEEVISVDLSESDLHYLQELLIFRIKYGGFQHSEAPEFESLNGKITDILRRQEEKKKAAPVERRIKT